MRVFLDTSALAKRYVAELGSTRVVKVCQQADSLAVCVICLPELISTLTRLVREKKITKADYRKLKGNVMKDLADIDICQITPDVLASGVSLLETNPLRAMDALHVACAVAVETDCFVSADHRQLAAARKTGLKIVDVS
ncbi:MAG: type II toxin-antitoxin system VapC family toxin [Acidiferrobacteraceae bacterium]